MKATETEAKLAVHIAAVIMQIDDGLHPTRICEYAGPFMWAVIEEGTL